jgi:transcriptional regulator with XRE-family HTH domain
MKQYRQERAAASGWAGQLIRGARMRAGFDVHRAADLLGVSAGYLFTLEAGMQPPPPLLCRRVAATFGMPQEEAAELLATAGVAQAAVQEERAWQRA